MTSGKPEEDEFEGELLGEDEISGLFEFREDKIWFEVIGLDRVGEGDEGEERGVCIKIGEKDVT